MKRQRPRWTDGLLPTEDSSASYRSVIEAFFAVDWAKNSLGPLEDWDHSTRSCVTLMLQSTISPVLLLLGPENTLLYNSAAMTFYQDRHPKLMGQPYAEGFGDLVIINELISEVENVKASGQSRVHDITTVKMWRSTDSAEEETFVNWEFVPLLDDNDEYTSVICTFRDHTHELRENSRSQFLTALHDALARTTTYSELYETCIEMMGSSAVAFRFVEIYTDKTASSHICVASYDAETDEKLTQYRRNQTDSLVHDVHESGHSLMVKIDCATSRAITPTYVVPIKPEADLGLQTHILVIGGNPEHGHDTTHEGFLKSCASTIASALGVIESSILLKQSDTRFQEMLLKTTIGFNVEDEKSRAPIFVNNAWREMTGFWTELEGIDAATDFACLLHPDGRDVFMGDYAKLTKDTPMHNRDVRLLRPYRPPGEDEQHPDDTVWLRVSSSYLPRSYKQPASLLFTVTDVSYYKYLERVALEELGRAVELQKLKSESTFERERADVAEASAAKHLQYIDFSSHELRNPLGAIMQAVDLSTLILKDYAEKSQDIQEVSDHLSSIMICAKHMGRIVDDTLSFSQLDHGALQIALMPCKLDITVLNVLTMFKAEMNVKRIVLDCQVEDTGTVMTDASRFSQILINMLTNALKFAPHDGTGRIGVTLSTREVQNKLRIDCSVRDNGPGMSPAVISSLFQKFSQASAKTHIQYGGSGLGLYISKRLTELLGGQIEAISEPDHGSELRFYILAEPVDSVLSPRVPQGQVLTRAPKALDGSSATKRHTLLIVEDNIVNQRLMSKLLGTHYTIHTANNGLECLQLMQSELGMSIDLVLCDIEMPIMNGYEAVQQVKTWQRTQGLIPVPFLAVSANSRPEQVKRMLDAGMNSTIRKPFGRKDILAMVESMLYTE